MKKRPPFYLGVLGMTIVLTVLMYLSVSDFVPQLMAGEISGTSDELNKEFLQTAQLSAMAGYTDESGASDFDERAEAADSLSRVYIDTDGLHYGTENMSFLEYLEEYRKQKQDATDEEDNVGIFLADGTRVVVNPEDRQDEIGITGDPDATAEAEFSVVQVEAGTVADAASSFEDISADLQDNVNAGDGVTEVLAEEEEEYTQNGLFTIDDDGNEVIILPEDIEFLTVYKQGTRDSSVAFIQQRLMDLGFMEAAEPTEYFGPVTMSATILFQRQNDLRQDGVIGTQSLEILLSPDAKHYKLKKGMEGDDIQLAQRRLYELGYLTSKSYITGKFDEHTAEAVKFFQSENGLDSDGVVGEASLELLYSELVVANVLSFGDKSDMILECQQQLKALGYLTTKPDGVYGNDTLAAVKLFQSRNDIVVDGYLGPTTREILASSDAISNGLVIGDSGDTVKRIQELLIKYGYLASGNNTGYFGSKTEAAVKSFQKANGLMVDGNVGAKTMAALTGTTVSSASSSSVSKKNSASGKSIDALIEVAKSKLGSPYRYGHSGPDSFDCSGFVYWCLNQIGIKQSYITSYGWRTVGKYTKVTNYKDLKRGDIVVVKGHVGIVAENGTVIDASSSNGKIMHRSLSSWWSSRFICGWRIFD